MANTTATAATTTTTTATANNSNKKFNLCGQTRATPSVCQFVYVLVCVCDRSTITCLIENGSVHTLAGSIGHRVTEQAVRRLAGCTDRSHTIWICHVCSSGVGVSGSSDSVCR